MNSETINIESIRQEVEERRIKEAGNKKKDNSDDEEKKSSFIKECLYANELGDGVLYADIHKGKFIYNKTTAEWLSWAGHHWQRDIEDSSLAAVESVSETYRKAFINIRAELMSDRREDEKDFTYTNEIIEEKEKFVDKKIRRLRSQRHRVNCRKFGHTNPINQLSAEGKDFDQHKMKFACVNGVVDLRTGNLFPGEPDDLIIKASPIEWKGIDEPALEWELFLKQIFKGDEELIEYLARLLGYGITGLTWEHVLPILWGRGRNGKSTLIEAIKYILGPLAAPIRSEMLLDQGRTLSSSGPTSDIMSLRGLRIAFASETDENRRFSPSKVKWLSGGDTLVGRNPHDRYETYFSPTHKLIMLTNELPHAPSHDFAFWERVHLIPFRLSFVDRDPQAEDELSADKKIPERLRQEASGILAWLVRGCLAWHDRGLDPPPIITEATAKFRRDEDTLADFIDERCFLDKNQKTNATILYGAYRDWFEINISKDVPSQHRFGKSMAKRFKRKKAGVYFYYGIGLLSEYT